MKKLTSIRLEKGLTQKNICDQTGIDQRTYSTYETGRRNMPIEKAKLIAEVIGVKWYELYD